MKKIVEKFSFQTFIFDMKENDLTDSIRTHWMVSFHKGVKSALGNCVHTGFVKRERWIEGRDPINTPVKKKKK